jgi:hypothetical protein
MSDYPRSTGDTVTEEERQYHLSESPDMAQLQKDLRGYIKMLGVAAVAAAFAAALANYKGGTRKRSARRSSRANKKKRSTRRR